MARVVVVFPAEPPTARTLRCPWAAQRSRWKRPRAPRAARVSATQITAPEGGRSPAVEMRTPPAPAAVACGRKR